MLKTPPGVEWPCEPVLGLERPMRMPFRYTCIVCSGTLTRTMRGPLGESSGCHQYSPGLSAPVGLPVGVPLVWKEGCCTACEDTSKATEIVRMPMSFICRYLDETPRRAEAPVPWSWTLVLCGLSQSGSGVECVL